MDESGTEVLELVHKTNDSRLVYKWEICYLSPSSDSVERSIADLKTDQHRWELPVGNYPGNSGNYHYPFFWVIFMVILHDFIF